MMGNSLLFSGSTFPFTGTTNPIFVNALFDQYPIGAQLRVGMDSAFWIGNFGGIQDGVALLTNAELFSNIGTPIDGHRPIVRIPLRNITFVST